VRFFIDKIVKDIWNEARWNASRIRAEISAPEAKRFYDELISKAYDPERYIRIAPKQRIIYITVGKAASTRIKWLLRELPGARSISPLKSDRPHRYRDLVGPRDLGVSAFYRLATGRQTLRFTFVRNPYDRLVSCWAHCFRGKPLVPSDDRIEKYLALRREIDPSLPEGAGQTLSFADFAVFAMQTNRQRLDQRWQLQSDIIDMPGIALDMIGKVETFTQDFARVLDHARAGDAERAELKSQSTERMNVSQRESNYAKYYTPELTALVYRAYEPDFDTFGYARTLPA
jgi:hypothetical protein